MSPWSAWKARWWQERERRLLEAHSAQEGALQAQIEASQHRLAAQKDDLLALEQRQAERKEELAKANEELRTQLRLLEAKASPTNVWSEAFSLGVSKAWDMMLPLMRESAGKSYEVIFADAVEQTLQGLETTICRRLDLAEKAHLRPANELLAKREEFKAKAATTVDLVAKQKYEHYVSALDWVLHQGSNGH